jgi:hypothetical protein
VLGGGYGTGQARERVLVVDASHAPRMRRAVWRYAVRNPALAGTAALLGLGSTAYVLALLRDTAGTVLWRGTVLWHLVLAGLLVAPTTVLAWGVLLAFTGSRLGRWVDREAVPGRMVAVTVGPDSVRVRDHDMSVELSYVAVEDVDQVGDVVVVQHPGALWALPVEIFDPVDLGVLRARTRRTRSRRRAAAWPLGGRPAA